MAWKGSQDEYQAFLDRHGAGAFPHLRDDTGEIFGAFGIRYQPGWVFLDDSGEQQVHPGSLTEDELVAAVEDLLSR